MSHANHLMFDIETMSAEPNAAVLAIGACTFNLYQPDEIGETFLTTISLASNEQAGRHFSGDTIQWWLTQSKDAQAGLYEGDITNLKNGCVAFRMWAQKQRPALTHVWANDPDFDAVITRQAFQAVGEYWPFGFWLNRSVRTIGDLVYPDHQERKAMISGFRAEGTHHKADDDAIAQAKFVQHCYQMLRTGHAFRDVA